MKNIEELKEAKNLAEAQITKIVAQLAHDFQLNDVDVDIITTKIMQEEKKDIIYLAVTTKITVKI